MEIVIEGQGRFVLLKVNRIFKTSFLLFREILSGLELLDYDLPSLTSLKLGGREIERWLNISIRFLESNAILSVDIVENDPIKLCTIKLSEHFSRYVNFCIISGTSEGEEIEPNTVGFDSKSSTLSLRVDNSLRSNVVLAWSAWED